MGHSEQLGEAKALETRCQDAGGTWGQEWQGAGSLEVNPPHPIPHTCFPHCPAHTRT